MDIAGEQVTVDANGIAAAGQSAPAPLPISTLNADLTQLGITLSVTNPTDKVSGPSASRTLDGLKISIDLKTLDSPLNQLTSLLPASVTSQLPIAVPDDQQLTLDLATVQVSSTASPAYVAGNSGNSGASAASTPSNPSAVSSADIAGNSGTPGVTGTTGTGGTFGGGSAGGGTSPASTTPAAGGSPTSTDSAPASVIAPAFKGIGAALVLLGVLAACALAYAYKRADDAAGVLGTSCADGDPLMERFTASADDLSDFGGAN
jgi:hypothetical protein